MQEESRRKTLIHLEYFEQASPQGWTIHRRTRREQIRVGDVVVAPALSRKKFAKRGAGVDFRVVVVDSGVNREARETLRAPFARTSCTYTTLGG